MSNELDSTSGTIKIIDKGFYYKGKTQKIFRSEWKEFIEGKFLVFFFSNKHWVLRSKTIDTLNESYQTTKIDPFFIPQEGLVEIPNFKNYTFLEKIDTIVKIQADESIEETNSLKLSDDFIILKINNDESQGGSFRLNIEPLLFHNQRKYVIVEIEYRYVKDYYALNCVLLERLEKAIRGNIRFLDVDKQNLILITNVFDQENIKSIYNNEYIKLNNSTNKEVDATWIVDSVYEEFDTRNIIGQDVIDEAFNVAFDLNVNHEVETSSNSSLVRFDALVEKRCEVLKTGLVSKRKEYAPDSITTDVFHNFKRAAEIGNTSPIKALFGFWLKHITSMVDIIEMVDKGNLPSKELLEEKVMDNIAYATLAQGMIEEERFKRDKNED